MTIKFIIKKILPHGVISVFYKLMNITKGRNQIKRTLHKISRNGKIPACSKTYYNKHIQDYINRNSLTEIIEKANKALDTGGVDIHDIVFIHSYIREKQPKYVLECGTGKSTWIISDALLRNKNEFGIDGKLISMEEHEFWYEKTALLLPDKYKNISSIHLSPISSYSYSFINGTCYSNIPDYPYELVFVDGPDCYINDESIGYSHIPHHVEGKTHTVANMDFIRLVQKTTVPMTAIIDFRTRTQMAYACVFGPNKVKYYSNYRGIGIIQDVTKADMVPNGMRKDYGLLFNELIEIVDDSPEWIK